MPGLRPSPCLAATAPRPYLTPLPPWTSTLRNLVQPGVEGGGGNYRQAGHHLGSAPLGVPMRPVFACVCVYVCVSKCTSQLTEVSRKACHTYNTHTHTPLGCPTSLRCHSPHLCPRGWPTSGPDDQAWAPPRAREAGAPQSSLLRAWPTTGAVRQQWPQAHFSFMARQQQEAGTRALQPASP